MWTSACPRRYFGRIFFVNILLILNQIFYFIFSQIWEFSLISLAIVYINICYFQLLSCSQSLDLIRSQLWPYHTCKMCSCHCLPLLSPFPSSFHSKVKFKQNSETNRGPGRVFFVVANLS